MLVAGIVGAVALLGASGRAGIDVLGGLIWLALALTRTLPMSEMLAGFGSEAVVLVAAMMAVSEALRRAGWAEAFGAWLADRAGSRESRALPLVAAVAACLGALIESTAAIVALVPVMARIGVRGMLRPRRLYMVVALGTMAGAMLTVVGTSGNLVANGVLAQLGISGFGYLEIAPLGLALTAATVLYAATLGRLLLPHPSGVTLDQAIESLRAYTAEVRVDPGFRWLGQTLRDAAGLRAAGIDVLSIVRGRERRDDPGPDERLQHGDVLTVAGSAAGVAGLTAVDGGETRIAPAVAEGLIPPGSPWEGRTLADIGARRSGLRVLGIWRYGETRAGRLATTPLRAGDVLLARGDRASLRRLQAIGCVSWLGEVISGERTPRWRLLASLAVLGGFVAAGAGGWIDLAAAAVAAAVAMAVCGCLPGRAAYDAIEWKVVLLLGGVVPLGEAISSTGLASRVAGWLAAAVHPLGPWAVLPVLFIAAAMLAQVLSNVAAAAVMTPVAARLAGAAGFNPKACVAVILIAAVATPVTRLASKPTLLVQDPGGYRPRDYLRVGLPFTAIAFLVAVLVPPHLWPAR